MLLLDGILLERVQLPDSFSRHPEGPASTGLKSAECASLAKLPHLVDDAAEGGKCEASPALGGHGLGREVEQRRRSSHAAIHFVAGPLRSKSSAIVGIRVHALVHQALDGPPIRGVELARKLVVSVLVSVLHARSGEEGVPLHVVIDRHLLRPRNFMTMSLAFRVRVGGRGGARARGGVAIAGAGAGRDGRAKQAWMDAFGMEGAGHVEMRGDRHGERLECEGLRHAGAGTLNHSDERIGMDLRREAQREPRHISRRRGSPGSGVGSSWLMRSGLVRC